MSQKTTEIVIALIIELIKEAGLEVKDVDDSAKFFGIVKTDWSCNLNVPDTGMFLNSIYVSGLGTKIKVAARISDHGLESPVSRMFDLEKPSFQIEFKKLLRQLSRLNEAHKKALESVRRKLATVMKVSKNQRRNIMCGLIRRPKEN